MLFKCKTPLETNSFGIWFLSGFESSNCLNGAIKLNLINKECECVKKLGNPRHSDGPAAEINESEGFFFSQRHLAIEKFHAE
jgi:hypothetical protein